MAIWTERPSVNALNILLENGEILLNENDTGDEANPLYLEQPGADTFWTDRAAKTDA